MSKQRRQQALLGILRAKRLSTQREVLEELERAGHDATQSSVSRDMDELGIVKRHGHYIQPPKAAPAGLGVLRLVPAGDCLVVLTCETGRALAVAYTIDRAAIPGVVGTIAGLDTVFIATRDAQARPVAIQQMEALFVKEQDR